MIEPAPKAEAKIVITNTGEAKLTLPKANAFRVFTFDAL